MRRWLALLALLVAALTAVPARADDTADQAKKLFGFGVRAYEAGQYRAALTAFEKAYALSPKPAILFSSAQALRRQWALDKQLPDLQRAIGYYRRYVDEVKEGGRVPEAVAALAELEPMAEKLGATTPEGTPPPEPQPTETARPQGLIMVSSSVKSAKATLNGKPVKMPLSEAVDAGKHVVVITAPGYRSWEREVQVAAGGSFAEDAVLVARRAVVILAGAPDGAEVLLDGRLMGDVPLVGPIETPAGRHRVAVLRGGHHPFVADLDLERGEEQTLEVELSPTAQRIASYTLFATGAAGLVVGSVLAGVAFNAQGTASEIEERRANQNISEQDRADYEAAVLRRDEYRRYAGVAFGAAGLLGAIGLTLFVFDSPEVEPLPPSAEPAESEEPEPSPAPSLEITASAPGAEVGLGLHLRW